MGSNGGPNFQTPQAFRKISLGDGMSFSPDRLPSELSDEELRFALAVEVCRWRNVRITPSGCVTGYPPSGLITTRADAPDWLNNEMQLAYLESTCPNLPRRQNPPPTARQRCEAMLLAVRREAQLA